VDTDPTLGGVIGGYRIEAEIGRGGMGVVYRAEQVALRRVVALKLIAPHLAEDPGFRERFERESRVAASIDHPNVIPVHEAGEADGALYISMRYVDGTDLRALIANSGRLEPRRATDLIAQVADALDAAHSRGLVHRDVKPANVLVAALGGREHAYLTDFGLTKHASSRGGLTKTGEWVGTVDYVSPEQIQGGELDARSDVYSLACVLHQALTGRVPYVRDSDVAKMYAHLHEPPPSVTEAGPDLPPQVDEVVARGMAKRPDERYPSAGDLGRAGLAAVEGQALDATERSVARGEAAPPTVPQAATAPSSPPTEPAAPPTAPLPASAPPVAGPPTAPTAPVRRRRGTPAWVALAAGLVGAAVLAGVLFATGVLSGDDEPPPRPAAERGAAAGGSEPGAEPDAGGDEEKAVTDVAPAGFTTYEAEGYTAEYPAEWRVGEDDVLKTTFRRTSFLSPDDSQSVLIDRSPGADASPSDSAAEVEAQTSQTAGYRRISFEPTTVNGRDAFEWVFELGADRRVDIFLAAGGDGYAVLGKGSDFDRVLEVARRVAGSIEPRP
jgi:predicted Ser/Thr protein kinase